MGSVQALDQGLENKKQECLRAREDECLQGANWTFLCFYSLQILKGLDDAHPDW